MISGDIKQLLDEVEHNIMNYQNRGLCYLPKRRLRQIKQTRGFDNSWYRAKTAFNNCYNITKATRALWLANSASTICPWVYAADVLTKAKRALCDVAQFVANSLGCTSCVYDILTTVLTRIVVDKSSDHNKPHSICWYLLVKLGRFAKHSRS